MEKSQKKHKLAAIVFTDIVGYTKRMEENEQRTMQLLQEQQEIVFPLVESYGGEVIKEIGDGLLIMFESAVQAVRFAISVQTRLKDEELTIRAGIHIGDVIFKDGDVFGSAVNTAARIEPLASANGICISEDVMSQLHNKEDIITISMGKQELKGVKEPIEIFEIFIEGVSQKRSRNISYILKDLWNRNVIQILIGYMIGAWVIKYAVSAIISQYVLSPHLIELSWILLISLIPTVFILAYFHGKRSSGKWTKIEIFGLPANILLSIVLLFFLFQGKDLGAATEKVTIENEDGEKITRNIPKSEFRKDIVFFFFDNKSGDESLDWLQYGITTLLVDDISQDDFIEATNAFNVIQKFRDADYPTGLDAPLMLKKEVAEYSHANFFITGYFNKKDDQWILQVEIYDTFKGSHIKSFEVINTNVFQLADAANIEIKKAVSIPSKQIEKATDLPIADVFTTSDEAFENYIKGIIEIKLNNDFPKAIEYAEKAVGIDADFAVAHLVLAEYYFNSNLIEKSEAAIAKTMKMLYNLPERMQFAAKFFYYLIQQKPDQANAILKMWTDLYPNDINARVMLAQRYLMKNDFEGAIDQYKYIIQLAPKEYEYIRTLGDIYEQIGNYDSSLYYYSVYAENFPNDPITYKNLGDTYLKNSQFKKALEMYNKALLIEPSSSSTHVKISRIHIINGEFKKAEELLISSLPECNTTQDSIMIISGLEGLYEMEGKVNKMFEYYLIKFDLYKESVPPLRFMVFQTFMISAYTKVNKQDEALRILKKIEAELQPPLDKVSAFGYLFYYADTKNPDKAAEYIDDAMELLHGFGEEMLVANVNYAEGRIAELREDFTQAIEKYKGFVELQPSNADGYRWVARSYFENGDMDEAEDYIQESLKRNPNNPKTLYEAARIFSESGDHDEALTYINKANEIWKDADIIYEPAQKARILKEEIILL